MKFLYGVLIVLCFVVALSLPVALFSDDLFRNYVMGGSFYCCDQSMRSNAVYPELIDVVYPIMQYSSIVASLGFICLFVIVGMWIGDRFYDRFLKGWVES